mmetsp:Transcript_5892/g.15431  ORF Transcript_5892/g.15431 Transcript_5892/m.15431 type:complete len:232 (+) Transcript_5892:62-757(+)
MDVPESIRASSVPRHRQLAPVKSCLKGSKKLGGSGGGGGGGGITIRNTPEKRLISPRTEATRSLFYTDEEYERFQREATSMRWLLDGVHEDDPRTESGGNVPENTRFWVEEPPRRSLDVVVPTSAVTKTAKPRVAMAPLDFGRANREFPAPVAPSAKAPVPSVTEQRHSQETAPSSAHAPATSHAHKMTRLEREIESMNMHELKDKIKEITRRRRERAQASRPYSQAFSYR